MLIDGNTSTEINLRGNNEAGPKAIAGTVAKQRNDPERKVVEIRTLRFVTDSIAFSS